MANNRLINGYLILSFFILAACSGTDKTGLITQTELLTRINDNSAPVILDVRSVEEYRRGRIPGAINVPYGDHSSLTSRLKLDKSKELVVYCESGARARKVENILKKQGFFELRHLEGDMREWRKAGLKTE